MRTTAPARSVRVVRQSAFLPVIRNARRSQWAAVFHRLLRHRLHHPLVSDPVNGCGNLHITSGCGCRAVAAAEFREVAGAHRRVLPAPIVPRARQLAALRRLAVRPQRQIRVNHHRRQPPAIRIVAMDSVAGNGMVPRGFSIPPVAPRSVHAMPRHRFRGRRMVRSSWYAAHLP